MKFKIIDELGEEYISVREAVEMSGLTRSCVHWHKQQGNLRHYKYHGIILVNKKEFIRLNEKNKLHDRRKRNDVIETNDSKSC